MVQNSKKNQINVYTASSTGGLKVSATDTRQVISATNNRAQYFAEQAQKYRDEAKQHRDNAKYYAEQNSDVTFEYIDNVKNSLLSVINTKQPNGDYALREELPINVSELENDIGYSTKQELLQAVPSQENCEGRFLYTNGEETSWKAVNSFALFDIKLSDHVLNLQESLGWALQGSYVYKEALAGSRYGYPDFYNKVIEEFNEATATEIVNGVTVKVNSNGHKFYDIGDKTAIDEFFSTIGTAWFYGVDTENERIFLPRNNYFDQATSDVSDVGKSVEAGVPNITGTMANTNHANAVSGYYNNRAGAFTTYGSGTSYAKPTAQTNDSATTGIHFDASRSSVVYGKSSTVQPNAVKKLLYICVGNTTNYEGMTDVVNQGMEILEQVNEGIATRADGQWTFKRQILSETTALGNYTYDLSDYLPNDGYEYEVQFESSGFIDHNSADPGTFWIGTEAGAPGETSAEILMGQSGWSAGHCLLKISNRVLYGRLANSQMRYAYLSAISYRRLGTNQ